MVTVIALVLGLTVVALQLASTQFSPRLLRNFLRDIPNQLTLSVFVATFAYSTAGLYTVGYRQRPARRDLPAARRQRRAAAPVREHGHARLLRAPSSASPARWSRSSLWSSA
ncbi:hypothetical protein CTI14_44445 [Methylobacterium radiotolerans]|nr:hypothetical protein CTI14_44445 [Methylobacterium radiotolerans]